MRRQGSEEPLFSWPIPTFQKSRYALWRNINSIPPLYYLWKLSWTQGRISASHTNAVCYHMAAELGGAVSYLSW